jgi:hypothetical protein
MTMKWKERRWPPASWQYRLGPGRAADGGDAVERLRRLPRHQWRQRRTKHAQSGQPVEVAIVDAMKKFKSGERPSTVMGRLAKGYSDAEVDGDGRFFSKQKLHPRRRLSTSRQGQERAQTCRKPTARAATSTMARMARTTRR